MTAIVTRGDARALYLPDESVDLIVTSPPYFALRSYTDDGAHYEGQIGSEATPADYIAALVECTREWMRVLKPSGSIFVNLGDKYSTGSSGDRNTGFNERWGNSSGELKQERSQRKSAPVRGMPAKSLLLLPERYRIACVDQLGLIARAVIVWAKPNGLPESVTDRVRRAHEDWVHLTKAPRYFAAVDEIREPSNPLGKLPGSVWEIATQPLTVPKELGVDHFAAFPMEWPRRLILGWSPAGICVECGEGRRPVAKVERADRRPSRHNAYGAGKHGQGAHTLDTVPLATITGYACKCAEPTAPARPAVVLDPFGGTGTTALVASVLGRVGISVDMSADYCRLAAWRTTDPGQIAAAMQVDKPAPVHEDQMDLTALWEVAS